MQKQHVQWEVISHRTIPEVQRLEAPLGLSGPSPSSRATQDHIWAVLVSLKGGGLASSLAASASSLPPAQSKLFPDGQREPPMLLYVPFTSCPVPGHHWKGPGSVSCTFPSGT